jgi:hypothetical protein
VFTRTRFKLLSRSNLHNKVLWLLVLFFTGSPIHPPLGALSRVMPHVLRAQLFPPHSFLSLSFQARVSASSRVLVSLGRNHNHLASVPEYITYMNLQDHFMRARPISRTRARGRACCGPARQLLPSPVTAPPLTRCGRAHVMRTPTTAHPRCPIQTPLERPLDLHSSPNYATPSTLLLAPLCAQKTACRLELHCTAKPSLRRTWSTVSRHTSLPLATLVSAGCVSALARSSKSSRVLAGEPRRVPCSTVVPLGAPSRHITSSERPQSEADPGPGLLGL